MAFDHTNPPASWPPEAIAALGTVPDRVVAEQLGVSTSIVTSYRTRLGIPSWGMRQRQSRNERIRALLADPIRQRLGTVPDKQLAEETGVPLTRISSLRVSLGIPPAQIPVDWTPERIARLGTVPDRVLAQEIGIQIARVRAKRTALGIAAYDPVVWSAELLDRLGTMSDTALARKYGVPWTRIQAKRYELGIGPSHNAKPIIWSADLIALLGTHHDHIIARQTGISASAIYRKRRQLGIPTYHELVTPLTQDLSTAEIDVLRELIGQMPDTAIAAHFSVDVAVITRFRESLGIAAP